MRQRLNRHAHDRWPHVDAITVRFRAGSAYVAAELSGVDSLLSAYGQSHVHVYADSLQLCRLRFTGMLHTWGFVLHLPAI
ncbi:hypothetical protein [Streptomyces hundungensis]|uniref:hypothetical protein n=1 Tax=Streptomyces hundungensis TaxID=1077946 RepID=UPI0033F438BC